MSVASVLIIDAQTAFSQQLADGLRDFGVDVRTTAGGRDGLTLAKSTVPDAIVLCAELGNMSGYSVCARLKKDEDLKGVPLVITSGTSDAKADFENHMKSRTRAEAYMTKPFSATRLVETLRMHISMPEKQASSGDTIKPRSTTSVDTPREENTKRIQAPQPNADEAAAKISALEALLTERTASLNQLESRIVEERKRREGEERRAADAQTKLRELEQAAEQRKALDARASQMQSRLAESNKHLEHHRAVAQAKDRELKRVIEERTSLEQRLSAQAEELAVLRRQVESAAPRLAEAQRARQTLTEELQQLRERHDDLLRAAKAARDLLDGAPQR